MKRKNKTTGTTLIEMILVMIVLGLLSSAGYLMFMHITKFNLQSGARLDLQRNSRTLLSNIYRELREASADSVIVDQLNNQPPHSRIMFTRYGKDGDVQTIIYYQEGSKLWRQPSGAPAILIAESLRSIIFSYPRSDDPTIISVSLSLQQPTYENQTKSLLMGIQKVRIMNP